MLGSIIPVDIFWQLIGEYRESEIRATNRELTKFPDTKRKGGEKDTHNKYREWDNEYLGEKWKFFSAYILICKICHKHCI